MNLNSIHNILDNKLPHYLQQKHLSKINVISKNVTATPHILRKQAKISFTFKWKNKMWSGQGHLKLVDFRLICGFLLAQQPNYIKVMGNRNIGRHFCKECALIKTVHSRKTQTHFSPQLLVSLIKSKPKYTLKQLHLDPLIIHKQVVLI